MDGQQWRGAKNRKRTGSTPNQLSKLYLIFDNIINSAFVYQFSTEGKDSLDYHFETSQILKDRFYTRKGGLLYIEGIIDT